MRWYLFLFLLATPILAQTPEEVVRKAYQTHLDSRGFQKTLATCQQCFTPEFLDIMERALAKKPGGPGRFVDWDFFVGSQAGFVKFEVGQAEPDGARTLVPILVWNDERGYRLESDSRKRDEMYSPLIIELVDHGSGYQIDDIWVLPKVTRGVDGGVFFYQGERVKGVLREIADS